jgi:hypothetical protein
MKFNVLKTTAFSLLAVTLALASAPRAQAGFAMENAVTISGKPVFYIDGACGGYSATKRAQLAQDALDNAIANSSNLTPSAVGLQTLNGSPILTFNGQKILTVDSQSARVDNKSLSQLAHDWECALQASLRNQADVMAYKVSLLANNPIQSTLVSASTVATRDMSLPVVFDAGLAAANLRPGAEICTTVSRPTQFGAFYVPADSQLVGKVESNGSTNLLITFNRLVTPSGADIPIRGTLCHRINISEAPHSVCTLSLPSGKLTAARIPATIAIGGIPQSDFVAMVITPDTDLAALPANDFAVSVERVAPVALLQDNPGM